MKAVILAAGDGGRMYGPVSREHKALELLEGIPIVVHGIIGLRDAGLREMVVVAGHAAEGLRHALGEGGRLGVTIEYVENHEWERGNGTSVQAVRDLVGEEPFVTVMADHWYEPGIPRRLVEDASEVLTSRLCVDMRLDSPHDPDDATKVVADGEGVIRELGKDLQTYNGLDCGLFLFTSDVFAELEAGFTRGHYSLGAAAKRLAAKGGLSAVDVTGLMWEDVDTAEALNAARRKVRTSVELPAARAS
jgi:choline kinase